jgi:hypothetical protein
MLLLSSLLLSSGPKSILSELSKPVEPSKLDTGLRAIKDQQFM